MPFIYFSIYFVCLKVIYFVASFCSFAPSFNVLKPKKGAERSAHAAMLSLFPGHGCWFIRVSVQPPCCYVGDQMAKSVYHIHLPPSSPVGVAGHMYVKNFRALWAVGILQRKGCPGCSSINLNMQLAFCLLMKGER
jgi:hypothetical protein